MNAKRTVLVMLTCIILGISQVLPVLGSVQGSEGATSPNNIEIQPQVVADIYEVTLKIIGPDGLPPTMFHLYIQQTSPSSDPFSNIYLVYGSEITLSLPLGTYLLQIQQDEAKPWFLAYCYLTVIGDNVISIDVRPLVAPVTMEAINPLEGKPFNAEYYYTLKDTSTKQEWRFYDDEPGKALVYLPVNTKFDAMFYQWGYILFKPNVNVRGLNTKIQFDGSKTGYIQPECVKPTNSPENDYLSAVYILFNGFMMLVAPTDAISIGSYTLEGMVASGFEQDWVFWFDLGRVVVAAKRTTSVVFGGDLVMMAKARRSSYKPGEELQIQYQVKDQFRHTLVTAQSIVFGNSPISQHEWGMAAKISDAGGLLSETTWQTTSIGNSMIYSMPISNLATTGTYNFTVSWDTEAYQSSLSASTKVVIRSSSRIPQLSYEQVVGDPATDNYEVTLRIIGPDGLPAPDTSVNVLQSNLAFEPLILSLNTGDSGEITTNLPRGEFLLQINKPSHQAFLTFCYFSVTGDKIINVDVQTYTVPISLEAINPLAYKPYTTNYNFVIRDASTGTDWGFWDFSEDAIPGKMIVYLPKNSKLDATFLDFGTGYTLHKASIQTRSTGVNIQFDGSKTGFIQVEYIPPTNPSGYQYEASIWVGNPSWCVTSDNHEAISIGNYPAEGMIRFQQLEGDSWHVWDYYFNVGKVTVTAGRTTIIKVGGDLAMTVRAKKASYKPGEQLQVEYNVQDHFKHKLHARVWRSNEIQLKWHLSSGISDATSLISEDVWETENLTETNIYSMLIDSLVSSGTYISTITWDSEVYQGPVSASGKFSVRSTSKIPVYDYNHLSGHTVRVGVIAPDSTSYETLAPYYSEIIQPDINTHYQDQNINFEFQVVDAGGSPQTHLDQVTAFHNDGVDLILGGGWSSQAQASLYYVNTNNMTLISSDSTSPTLAIAGDRLLRFCPSDSWVPSAMVDILWSRGIRYVVAMQALGFGDDFINIFQPLWTAKGGKYIRIQYDPGAGDFSRLLMEAEVDTEAALVKYPGKVAELLLGFDEVADIAVQAQGYPHLYNDVKWFFGGSASNQELIEKAGLQLTELGFYNLLPAEPVTVNYWDLKQRFEATTSTPFDIYNAYAYDAAFALVGAVVTAESTDAGVVSAALPGFCKTYTGVSGNCALNTYGDRVPGPYDIWSYGDVEGDETVESVKVGYGVPRTHQVTWDINVGGVLALDSVSASGSSSTCTAYIRNIGKIDRIVTTAYVNGLQADVEATLIPRNEVVPIVITDNFVEGVNYEVKVACSDIPFLIFSVIAGP